MLRRAVKASDRLAPGQQRGSNHVQQGRNWAAVPGASTPLAVPGIQHAHSAAAAPPPKHQPPQQQQQPQNKHRALAAFSEIVRKAGAGSPAVDPRPPAAAAAAGAPNNGLAAQAAGPAPAAATASRLSLAANKPTAATTAAASLQHAHTAAAALLQQVQQEGCTYLYEYACQVRALVTALQQCAAAGTSTCSLWPLQLLQLCCGSWEACAALVEQQASNPGQSIAQELQPAHAAAQALLEQALQHSSLWDIAALAGDAQLQEYCNAVVGLVQMGKAWLLVTSEPNSSATWYFQILRQQLPHLSQLSQQAQDADLLQQLQLMQFHTLHGSLLLASQQGHKVLWSNLMAQLQQLLSSTASGPSCSATMALVLAGTLVQETERLTAGVTPVDRVLLLGYAVELLACSYVQVEEMEDGAGQDEPNNATEVQAVKEQLLSILQQALLNLAEAYLDSGDAPKALATCQQMQALPAPPLAAAAAGLLSVQAQAYLQQGRLGDSAQHFSRWLGCGAEDLGPCAGSQAASYMQQLLGRPDDLTPALEQLLPAVAAAAGKLPSLVQQVIAQLLASVALSSSCMEGNLVALLADQRIINIILQSPQLKSQCHQVLYEQGLHHHSMCQYARAATVLKPANFFSPPHLLSKTAKLQAACLLQLQQPGAAASYLHMAGQQTGERTMAQVLLQLQAHVAEPAASCNTVQDLIAALSSCSDFNLQVYKAVAELCLEHHLPGPAWQALAAWHEAAAAAGCLSHFPTILKLLLEAYTALSADKGGPAAAERLALVAKVLHGSMALWTKEQVEQQGERDMQQLHGLAASSLWVGLQALQLGAIPSALEAMQAAAHFTSLQAAAADKGSTSSCATWQQAHLLSLKTALLALLSLHDSNCTNTAPLQLARSLLQAAKDATLAMGRAGSRFGLDWLHIQCAIECQAQEAADFKAAMKQLAAHPGVTAADMQALAATCLQKRPWHSAPHAAVAYGHMLRITTDSAPPDAASAVAAAQGLLLCSPSPLLHQHACQRLLAALELCQLADQLQQTLLEGLQWLVTKCWNGAVQQQGSDPQAAGGYWCSATGLLWWLHRCGGPSGQHYALQLQGSAAYKVLQKHMAAAQQQVAAATAGLAAAPAVVSADDRIDGELVAEDSADEAAADMEAAPASQQRLRSSASAGNVGSIPPSLAAVDDDPASPPDPAGFPGGGMTPALSLGSIAAADESGCADSAASPMTTLPVVASPSTPEAAEAADGCKQTAAAPAQGLPSPPLEAGSQLGGAGLQQPCSSSTNPMPAAGFVAQPGIASSPDQSAPALEALPSAGPQAPAQTAAAPAATVIPSSQAGDVNNIPMDMPRLSTSPSQQQVSPKNAALAASPGSQPAAYSSRASGREQLQPMGGGKQAQCLESDPPQCVDATQSEQGSLGTVGIRGASQQQTQRKRSHDQLQEVAGTGSEQLQPPSPATAKATAAAAAAAAGLVACSQLSKGPAAKRGRLQVELPPASQAAPHGSPVAGHDLEQMQGEEGGMEVLQQAAASAAGGNMQHWLAAAAPASSQAEGGGQAAHVAGLPADSQTGPATQHAAVPDAGSPQAVVPSSPSHLLGQAAAVAEAAAAASPRAVSMSEGNRSAAVDCNSQQSQHAAAVDDLDPAAAAAAAAVAVSGSNPGVFDISSSQASQPTSSSQQHHKDEGPALAQGSPGGLVCSRDMDVDVLSLALTS